EREAADPGQPVRVERPHWLSVADAQALCDAAHDFERGPVGPLTASAPGDVEAARAALALARLAGVVPALWIVESRESVAASAAPADIIGSERTVKAAIVARANLPLDGLPPVQMVSFRAPGSGADHVALIVGAPGGKPPL